MINISNALYITALPTLGNRPIVGWQSIITLSNLSASEELASRPAINLWNPDTYLVWEADVVPTDGLIYITIENTGSDAVDYIGIAKHNFGTAGIEYNLQESDNGADYTDVTDARTPTDDSAIVDYFDQSSANYFRLQLNCGATAPVIGHMKLGAALILQHPMYVGHEPETLSRYCRDIANVSDTGQYLGTVIVRRWQEGMVKQQNTEASWVRTYLTQFIQHVAIDRPDDGTPQGPFFFAWRPAVYPLECIYGWAKPGSIKPQNQSPNGDMEYDFKITGIA